jgi:hypothetical protein
MNVYGLFAVNRTTFNSKENSNLVYPKVARDRIITSLKIHNLTLNVLGYIPAISLFSGCVRILIGIILCAVTLKRGDPHAKKGAIIGHWYREALLTGITQIARGVFEAFVPFGFVVNASLDVIGTIYTISKVIIGELIEYKRCSKLRLDKYDLYYFQGNHWGAIEYGNGVSLHQNPKYPLPFKLLYLV